MKKLIFILCVISLCACSQGKLTARKTTHNLIAFQLSSDFVSEEGYEAASQNEIRHTTDIYNNGDYKLYIDVYETHYPHLEKMFQRYKSEGGTYNLTGRTMKKAEKINIVANENGYDFVAFYGVKKDPSVLLPNYYGVCAAMIKTPKYFVSIKLKQHERRLGAMDKDESMRYLTSVIQTMKQQ